MNNFVQVDFYWINREQRSFEWFVSLLSQLEIEQAEQGGAMERQGLISYHSHFTN
jgi:Ferric reductase NAD binding domain